MSRNKRALIAGAIALLASGSIVIYGFSSHHTKSVLWGLLIGVVIVIVDWATRKPGRKLNQDVMKIARATGIVIFPLATFLGIRAQIKDQIGVFSGSLVFPLVLYIVIATIILSRKRPGFWNR